MRIFVFIFMMRALVDTQLRSFLERYVHTHDGDNQHLQDYVQPSSVDIPLGNTIYELSRKRISGQTTVREMVESATQTIVDHTEGYVLKKGKTYLVPCMHMQMPPGRMAKISPKSSIGRIDVHVRSLFDNTGLYDLVFPNTRGRLWLEITPQSFNVRIHPGNTVSQLRIFDTSKRQKNVNLFQSFVFPQNGRESSWSIEGDIIATIGLNYTTIGYQAKTTEKIIDISRVHYYAISDFFQPISLTQTKQGNEVCLHKDNFYILATKEAIRIPLDYSMEVLPFSHHLGELRAHYAGFFDPGFGGAVGKTGVLEVRTHHDIVVYDGQPVCLLRFYKNTQFPERGYGDAGNHYVNQHGPQLAKFFISQ